MTKEAKSFSIDETEVLLDLREMLIISILITVAGFACLVNVFILPGARQLIFLGSSVSLIAVGLLYVLLTSRTVSKLSRRASLGK